MDVQKLLQNLGVTDETLSADEKAFLDKQGYLPLPDILSGEEIDVLRTRLQELTDAEGDQAGTEFHQEAGSTRLSNLSNKGEIFEICYTHPRILAAMNHVLQGDFKLSSLNARAARPGGGHQAFHTDWGEAIPADDLSAFQVCNSIWLLDDFTEDNGATRVVPGSHRSGQRPSDAMTDPTAVHPNQVLLTAPAGTVVIFNSHTWHGGTLNRTNNYRRALHSYFCRRHHKQQVNQRAWLSAETVAGLSEEARFILDV
ncbi:MAG: phytanoyl-CoA dioxygenase family protein [Chloroflexota bacterium]